MRHRTIDVLVGVFIVLAFICLFFLALYVSRSSDSSGLGRTYVLYANFDNVGQLHLGAPVKSAGVVVGRVAAIQLDYTNYSATVKLEMDGRYRLPTDSSLSVLTSGLLGDQYLGIDPGLETHFFKAGETVRRTQSAVVLEKLISQFLFDKAKESPVATTAVQPVETKKVSPLPLGVSGLLSSGKSAE